jgi:enoyl-CoA hydratase/carnithine racemase
MLEEETKNIIIEIPRKIDEKGYITKQGIDGNYATISINRPDRLNAITLQVINEIAQALRDLELNSDVRCVVLRGVKKYTKKPSFSVGQDLNAVPPPSIKPNIPMSMSNLIRIYHIAFDEIEQFSKPLIAAVDGFALGGGTEMSLMCDIVIASKRSIFGLTEILRGIFPAGGGTQRLAKRIGVNRALRVLFFGEMFSAEQMYKWGLVNFLVDDDKFEDVIHKKAKWLGNAATTALFNIKKCIKYGTRAEQLGTIIEQLGAGINSASRDRAEGRKAFFEKRDPEYKGI